MANKLDITKTSLKQTIKEWVIITLGVFLYSFAWVGVIMPAKGVGGGATGLALIINYATQNVVEGGVSVGLTYFIINAILVIAAVIILSAKFGIKTIYAIILMSVTMSFLQSIIPDNILGLADDKLLSAILGAVFAGSGVSLVLMQGGSTGGSDIVAMIVNKYRNVSYGRVVLITDCIIIASSLFIGDTNLLSTSLDPAQYQVMMQEKISTIIYGIFFTIIFSIVANSLLDGNKQSAQIFVMSEHYKEIADLITSDLHRGVTILDGMGWYTKKPTKVLMVAVRKNESAYMLNKIKMLDPKAFITMGSVRGVYGEGFDTFRK